MRFLIGITLILNLLYSGHVAAVELHKDLAVFKIQKKTIFYTDLKLYSSHLNKFRCLQGQSAILKVLKLNRKYMRKLPRLKPSYQSLEEKKDYLLSLLKLIKMQVYTSRYSISISRDRISQLPSKKCGVNSFNKWPNELKSLFQMELYLRERFTKDSIQDNKELRLFVDSVDNKIDHALYF